MSLLWCDNGDTALPACSYSDATASTSNGTATYGSVRLTATFACPVTGVSPSTFAAVTDVEFAELDWTVGAIDPSGTSYDVRVTITSPLPTQAVLRISVVSDAAVSPSYTLPPPLAVTAGNGGGSVLRLCAVCFCRRRRAHSTCQSLYKSSELTLIRRYRSVW